jgi:DNA polymerase-3 subunit delta'
MSRLVGQKQAETMLARAIAAERVSHAYLFLGPGASGKTTAAHLFAQALNCENLQPESQQRGVLSPCGKCRSCRLIESRSHPEVVDVEAASKSGQNISIEQAREIRLNATLRPRLGRRRVYIFASAEKLSEPAANALLKTLEEPSETVCLILCAPSPSFVLPTIRSRCQTVRFGLAPAAEIAAVLVEGGTDAESAGALARASGGRTGLALSWARNPSILEQRRQVLQLFSEALASQADGNPTLGAGALRLAEQLVKVSSVREKGEKGEKEEGSATRIAREGLRTQLDLALTFLRDRLLLTLGAEESLVQNQDFREALTELARNLSRGRALQDVQIVREAQQLLDRNVTTLLVAERMFWALIAGPVPSPPGLFLEDAV